MISDVKPTLTLEPDAPLGPHFLPTDSSEEPEKLEEHGVDPEDFEAIVQDPEDVERSHTGRLIAFGNDCEGRLLACVYDLDADGINVHPITAYRIED